MPPKAKPTAAAASPDDAQRSKDALTIFNSLFNVASPIMINIAEIVAKTNEKPDTVRKRFSVIRKRYEGLNIQTTNAGADPDAAPSAVAIPQTPTRKTSKAAGGSARKTKSAKKSAVTVDAEDLNDDEEDDDQKDANDAKPTNGGEDEDVGETNDATTPAPATPNDKIIDTDLADDEKSVKKPKAKAKASAAKSTKPKAKTTPANKKRKLAEGDDASPAPEPKKTKVAARTKKPAKAKAPVKAQEQEEDEETKEGSEEDDNQVGKHHVPNTTPIQKSAEGSQLDLALDTVKDLAAKSLKNPITKSPKKVLPEPVTMKKSKVTTVEETHDEQSGGIDSNIDTAKVNVEKYMASKSKAKSEIATNDASLEESDDAMSVDPNVSATAEKSLAEPGADHDAESSLEVVEANGTDPSTNIGVPGLFAIHGPDDIVESIET